MNAQILLAGDYTDQVTIRSNLINGDNCSAGDNVSFSHIEGKDSSTYSNYTHVDGISSTIDNSINSKILGNNSNITGSNNSIIIGHNSIIDKSPNSILLGYASINGTTDVSNNIIVGRNVSVDKGKGNLILASHSNSTNVSPNNSNSIYFYTEGGLDNIYVNNIPFTKLTNTFGMKDVYGSLENTDGIAFITKGETSKYTIVSACVPPSGLAPEFDLRGSQRVMVKDYIETELTNPDSSYYSANIGYVNSKFDAVGIDGGSLSLTTSDLSSPGYYYLMSIDKVNGSGIVVTGNTSIITTSNVEYHYNFSFELHVCNKNIISDTYVLNTNNLALFNNTIKCLYKTDGSYVYVYIQTSNASNTVSQLTLDLSVKHTAPSNAIFRKLEPSETDITDGIYLRFDKSIIQSTGNKVEVDLTGSGSVKAPTVSLANSKKTDYKNNVVTCGLLSEFTNGVVLLTGDQSISGTKTFTGDCIVNSIDISKNTTSTKAVNCSSLAKYLNNLGLSSGSTYVTIAGNQTITGEKTFSSKATFNGHIYSGNANGLNIVNSNNNKSSALRLYGGPDTNNGAEIILNSKAANGCWSIKAIDSNNNKILYGSPTTLTWGGKRVLTELDLDPINTRLTNIENLIGQINSVLEANVGWES